MIAPYCRGRLVATEVGAAQSLDLRLQGDHDKGLPVA